jgi:hypothetical protein
MGMLLHINLPQFDVISDGLALEKAILPSCNGRITIFNLHALRKETRRIGDIVRE